MSLAVIIPCRNVAGLVRHAVRSAIAQGDEVREIIAVDDGSTDGTVGVLRSMAGEAGGKLRVLEQPAQGASEARNAGLQAASSDFAQFLDADDILLPGKIDRQLALARREAADIVVGGYRNRYASGRPDEEVPPWPGDPWEGLLRTRLGTTSANLFRRDAVIGAGGWRPGMGSSQDYDLLFRMMKRGARVAMDPVVGAEVLKRSSGSISVMSERENWLRYLELRAELRDHLRGMGAARAPLVAVADQYLFNAIRVLSTHDAQAALEAHQRLIPKGFVPKRDKATTGRYALAYRVLGFRWAERLAELVKRR